jgi:pentatricopeptide repeat protein
MPLFQIKPGVFSLDLLAHEGPNPASYSARVHACASAGDFETAVNTVHDMELAFSSLQDSKGLEILSPCSSLWPLVLAIAQAGPGALDVACYKLAEIHGSGRAVSLAAIKCVLQGCANIWDVYCACQTFEAISSTFGLTPDIHSINALLDAFGKVKKVGRLSKHSWSPQCLAVVPS